MYFTLKDDKSLIKAIMFKTYTGHLDFVPQDGMKVNDIGKCICFLKEMEHINYMQKAMKQLGKNGRLKSSI